MIVIMNEIGIQIVGRTAFPLWLKLEGGMFPMNRFKKITALLCAMIFSFSCACCFGEEETVTVPDVIGMEVNAAEELLEKEGFNCIPQYYANDSIEENYVFLQNPAANKTVQKGETVMISVSSGPRQVSVPDLQGMNINEATELVKSCGLYPIRERVAGTDAAVDTVISQIPAANDKVYEKTDITLFYSSGETHLPGAASGNAETQDIFEVGLEAAGILEQMIQSNDYLDFIMPTGCDKDLLDSKFNTGDYDTPVAVYRLNQADPTKLLNAMMSEDEQKTFAALPPALQDQLIARIRGVSTLSLYVNSKSGLGSYTLTTSLQVQLDSPGLEPEEPGYYLFVFEKGVPVLVTCGWHKATGMFLVLSKSDTESSETLQAALSPFCLEVSPVDIPASEVKD